jgi:uncharacterized metal-binding protein YceD (DUF177 family)
MQLYLDRLAPGRSELEVDEWLSLDGPDRALVQGRLAVDNMDQRILVRGELQVRRTMDCHRCGRPSQQDYPAQLELIVLRRPGRAGWLDRPTADEEPDNWVIHASKGVVDLADALREAVVLDEPILIRCGPDCPFGRERESSSPDRPAASEPSDPRWEKLRRLRDADDDAE